MLQRLASEHELKIRELEKEHEAAINKLQAKLDLQSESLRSEIEASIYNIVHNFVYIDKLSLLFKHRLSLRKVMNCKWINLSLNTPLLFRV